MKTASQRGRRNRQKGQEFEREVCDRIALHIGRPVKRNLGQERDGGCDITVGPILIECKRRKRISVLEWLNEVAIPAEHADKMPVVVMRADGWGPKVMLDLVDFLDLCGDKLR